MNTNCQKSEAENLVQCFCLCNDVGVSYDSKLGKNTYDGESQDELLLLLLSQAGSFYELIKRDQHSITLLDKRSDKNITF